MATASEAKLGAKAKDLISGFEGIITARSEFLNGCVRVLIQSEKLSKEGKPDAGEWIDVQQIKVLDATPAKTRGIIQANTGGPRPDARRRADAPRR
jgi:hypothetical protein